MAKQEPVARKQTRSERDKQRKADPGTGKSGREERVAEYEKELAGYLLERIKPGLNRGAIPLLARSIAKEIAHREHPNGAFQDAEVEDEPSADAEDEPSADAEDEPSADAEDEPSAEDEDEPSAEDEDEPSADAEDEPSGESDAAPDFEADMHEFQEKLGEEWVVHFSVHGKDAWLTAEKEDGTQRLEAQTASVLAEAVELLNKGGGRSP